MPKIVNLPQMQPQFTLRSASISGRGWGAPNPMDIFDTGAGF